MNSMALLSSRVQQLRGITDYFNSGDQGDPSWAILLIAVVVMAATAYYFWRLRSRLERMPSGQALLKRAAEQLGLSRRHRRLMAQMADLARIEPAAALASTELLAHTLRCSRLAGLELSSAQSQMADEICAAVADACKR